MDIEVNGAGAAWAAHQHGLNTTNGLGAAATKIAVVVPNGTQAAQGTSFFDDPCLPGAIPIGMSLLDTTDSVLMTGAYGSAFVNPIRKLWYNLTITAASVVIAIFIGALGLIGNKLGFEGRFWSFIGSINDSLANFGYALVGGSFPSSSIALSATMNSRSVDREPGDRATARMGFRSGEPLRPEAVWVAPAGVHRFLVA
jgi:high-affinity nickel-transport protein